MENFNIMQVHWKGGHRKKQCIGGNCLKKGAWTVCEKQQIKLFLSNSLLIDKLNLKIYFKMLSQIGLIYLFCSPYLPQGSYRISIFVCPFFQPGPGKQASSIQLTVLHISHWFELLYKIPLILYCEHLQHFTKEICSFYFMSLPNSRPRLIEK